MVFHMNMPLRLVAALSECEKQLEVATRISGVQISTGIKYVLTLEMGHLLNQHVSTGHPYIIKLCACPTITYM